MKKIRKIRIISLCISLIMMFHICLCNASEANGANDALKEIQILNALDIITAEDIQNSGETVTRAEFAQYAAKALMLYEVPEKIYFKDVGISHWANGYVNALVEKGAIDIAADGYFNPEVAITPEQAYKIMLVSLGYKEIALQEAEIMSAYAIVARKTGIAIKTQNKESITIEEAAQIIYNAMNIGQFTMISSGNEVTSWLNEDDTLMTTRDIYYGEGRVTTVYGLTMDEMMSSTEENVIYIDGEKYYADSELSIEKYFGRYVEFIYQENDSEKILMYAEPLPRNVLEVKSENIKSYDAEKRSLRYYKNTNSDNTAILNLPSGIPVVLNGNVYNGRLSAIMDDFVNKNRYGEIIAVEGSSGYDLLIINSYRTVVAKGYNNTAQIFYDFYNISNNLDISTADIVKYISVDGVSVDRPSAFNTVMCVAESEDNTVYEIVVCDEQLSGVIDGVYYGEQEIKIGENIYEVTDSAWNQFGSSIRAGRQIKALTDVNGKIAYIEFAKDDSMNVGYLITAGIKKDAFSPEYLFKVFSDGVVSVYSLADRVTLDGTTYNMKNPDNMFAKFPNFSSLTDTSLKIGQQVFRYSLDGDGRIKKIDTLNLGPNENPDESLRQIHDGANSLWYHPGLGRFGMDSVYNSSYCEVFTLPSGVSANNTVMINGVEVKVDDSMYSSSASFTGDATYSVEIYDYDAQNPNKEIIVARKSPLKVDNNFYMVKGVGATWSDEGIAYTSIECVGPTGEKNIVVDETQKAVAETLKEGDIIVVDNNLTGKRAYGIYRYAKNGEDVLFDDATNGRNLDNPHWFRGTYDPYNATFRATISSNVRNLTMGYANRLENGILEISHTPGGEVKECVKASSVPVVVYDSSARDGMRIYKGTISDIDVFTTAGYNCSKVFIGYASISVNCVFVYK